MDIGKKVLLLILILAGFCTQAQTDEYLIKAGLLEKFSKFTVWPNQASTKEFKIVIIGKSPFKNHLEKLYKNRKINHLPVSITYIQKASEISQCHILFISQSVNSKIDEILKITHNKPILTISEYKGNAKKGVLINFYETYEGTIHFEMNANKIKEASLSVNSMLLNYAKVVN